MSIDETTMPAPTVASIDALAAAYERALAELTDAAADCESAPVMQALLAREALARALAEAADLVPKTLYTIADLDQDLKQRAAAIDALAGRETLERWRATIQPPATAWWWQLDQRAAALVAPSPLWSILAGIIITVSLSLSAEITQRFLSTGADALSFFNTAAQALLTLIAGSALTELGWKAISRRLERLRLPAPAHPLLGRIKLPPPAHSLWKAVIALIVLGLVVGLWLALPGFARYYNDNGQDLHDRGQVSGAIQQYLRAVSLAPDFAPARYNLATAYEDVLEYDKALGEYQRAVEADNQFYAAYNNLARLYIIRQQEYGSALALLNRLINVGSFSALPESVQYSLLKNRGWAYFGLKLYDLAEADLRQAQELWKEGAAAHCLLAQVLEAQQKPPAVLQEWEGCLAYQRLEIVEPEWPALAKSRLNAKGGNP